MQLTASIAVMINANIRFMFIPSHFLKDFFPVDGRSIQEEPEMKL
jgi:hypothetical protein